MVWKVGRRLLKQCIDLTWFGNRPRQSVDRNQTSNCNPNCHSQQSLERFEIELRAHVSISSVPKCFELLAEIHAVCSRSAFLRNKRSTVQTGRVSVSRTQCHHLKRSNYFHQSCITYWIWHESTMQRESAWSEIASEHAVGGGALLSLKFRVSRSLRGVFDSDQCLVDFVKSHCLHLPRFKRLNLDLDLFCFQFSNQHPGTGQWLMRNFRGFQCQEFQTRCPEFVSNTFSRICFRPPIWLTRKF